MHQSMLTPAAPNPGHAGTVGAFVFQDFGTVECPCNQDMFLNVLIGPTLVQKSAEGQRQ